MNTKPPPPETPAKAPLNDATLLLEFMYRLGQGYLACGEQTAKVELLLRRIAAAYGMRKSRVVAFPTAIFISLHDSSGERVTLAECEPQSLRLDQMADIYALGDAAQRATIEPREALERLGEIRRQKARFGRLGIVAGHTILTVGLTMVLMPTLTNLAVAAILGLIVGLIKLFNRSRTVLSVPLSAQRLATLLFGSEISGFFGTLIATPLGYLIELRFISSRMKSISRCISVR
jgi:uncharacterized membrane protein YjjP (DUF1212 family)